MQNRAVPTTVYLDTSDWAYLQEGKARDAELVLRRMARDGSIAFLISEEHLIEVAGLSHGREERLAYLRRFPGTYLQGWEVEGPISEPKTRNWGQTVDLLQAEAKRLSEVAAGRDFRPPVRIILSLATVGMDLLRRFVDEPGTFTREKIYAPSADIIRDIREAASDRTRDDVESHDKVAQAALAGDYGEVARLLIRAGKLSEEAAIGFEERMAAILPSLLEDFRERIPVPERDLATLMSLDPIFRRAVVRYLPDVLRTNAVALMSIGEAWKDKRVRAVVPSLAAHAALIEALHYQPQSQFKNSELSDQMHAAYAPLVDYFTCDKRNVERLSKALAPMGDDAPEIMRTKKLDELARKLGT